MMNTATHTAANTSESLSLPESELFRTVLESASSGIKVVDLETSRVVGANPAFRRMLGYTLDELQSRPVIDFTYPDDRAFECAVQEKALAGQGDSFQLVKRYVHKNGSASRADVTGSIVRNAEGRAHYRVSMVNDIGR